MRKLIELIEDNLDEKYSDYVILWICGLITLLSAYGLAAICVTLYFGVNHIFQASSCNVFQELWWETLKVAGVLISIVGFIAMIVYSLLLFLLQYFRDKEISMPKWWTIFASSKFVKNTTSITVVVFDTLFNSVVSQIIGHILFYVMVLLAVAAVIALIWFMFVGDLCV